MQVRLPFRFRGSTVRAFVAAVLIAGYLLTLLLAASPDLHQLAHTDAAQAGHHCVVTEISQGNLLSAPLPALGLLVVIFALVRTPALVRLCAGEIRAHPERGPPFSPLLPVC